MLNWHNGSKFQIIQIIVFLKFWTNILSLVAERGWLPMGVPA